MPRAQNAHAYVNAAFLMDIDMPTGKVNSARICFGGINPEFVHATNVEEILKDQCFYDKDVLTKLFTVLPKTLEPNSVLPDASPDYRRNLACGLMYKCILDMSPAEKIKPEYKSGAGILKRDLSSGSQKFETDKKYYPISQPVEKIEGMNYLVKKTVKINFIKFNRYDPVLW